MVGTSDALKKTMKTTNSYMPGREDDDVPDYLTAD
jgi:hypothetical protein